MRLGRCSALGVLLGSAWAITGCEKTEADEDMTPVVVADEQAAGADRFDAAPRDGSAASAPGYDRLLAATEGIPPNPMVGSAERLARARAWVEANRPDKSPRERELEAQLIAVMESILSDDVRLDAFGAVMEFHALELWSKDLDGDGVISEDEALSTQDSLEGTTESALMYFGDRFDTDGDGEISSEESEIASERFETGIAPVMGTLVERSKLRAWDENGDGVLSEAESLAGHRELGIDPDDPRIGSGTTDELYGLYHELVDGFERVTEFLPQGDKTDAYNSLPHSNRRPPKRQDYDFDGDGIVTGVEQQTYVQENDAWLAEWRANERHVQVAGVQADYAVAIERMDGDGDGRIGEAEWISGFATLRAERDARIFNHFYDHDADGSISDAEVVRYMNAYENRSPHADVDLNGQVDQADLLIFRDRVLGR